MRLETLLSFETMLVRLALFGGRIGGLSPLPKDVLRDPDGPRFLLEDLVGVFSEAMFESDLRFRASPAPSNPSVSSLDMSSAS